MVTEPTEGSEEFTSQLGEAIGTLFSRFDFSITGNLTRALRAAHEHLRDWNRTSMPTEQAGAGASVLALREDVGYVAQVGPSFAIYGDGSRARRVSPATVEAREAIGLATDFRPSISRFELALGESILLSGSRLAYTIQDEHATALMGMDPEEALGQVYVLLKEQRNLGAILISHVAVGSPHAPLASPDTYEQPRSDTQQFQMNTLDEGDYSREPVEPEPRRREPPEASRDPFGR
ncbi:MAG: hypothetical protein GEU28_03755 [Dehalococcoidia bacterium]|nr:hypothetical protein [Dehalococcoidia bacterium]